MSVRMQTPHKLALGLLGTLIVLLLLALFLSPLGAQQPSPRWDCPTTVMRVQGFAAQIRRRSRSEAVRALADSIIYDVALICDPPGTRPGDDGAHEFPAGWECWDEHQGRDTLPSPGKACR